MRCVVLGCVLFRAAGASSAREINGFISERNYVLWTRFSVVQPVAAPPEWPSLASTRSGKGWAPNLEHLMAVCRRSISTGFAIGVTCFVCANIRSVHRPAGPFHKSIENDSRGRTHYYVMRAHIPAIMQFRMLAASNRASGPFGPFRNCCKGHFTFCARHRRWIKGPVYVYLGNASW